MKTLAVYNLEFPTYNQNLDISGYKFVRVPNYNEAFSLLAHKINVSGSEFPIVPTTGTHQQTATVEVPDHEQEPILPWDKSGNYKKLQDILLFLTLFTGRNVFALNPGEEKYPLRPDPREHFYGGQFHLSARQDIRWQHKKTGELLSGEQIKGKDVYAYEHIDIGLGQTIEEVVATIASEEWRKTYGDGYSVFLFRQAMRQDSIEPAFLLCWTIWEHLFALNNKEWLDDTSIEQTGGEKKIAYILNKYLLVSLNDDARREIKRLTRARNRLAHFGKKPDNVELDELTMVVRLTEQIMAIVLGLKPSNAFNSIEQLQRFLEGKK